MSSDPNAFSSTSPGMPASQVATANPPSASRGAIIGPSTRIHGDLQADEDLVIEGSVTGTLILRNNLLSVGAKGIIKGTAFAKAIAIDGHIEGELYATERISIRKGAQVKGTIMSPRVSLEDGAVLRGTVEMDHEAIREAIQSQFAEHDKAAPQAADSRPSAIPPATRPAPAASNPPSPSKEAEKPDAAEATAKKPQPATSAAR